MCALFHLLILVLVFTPNTSFTNCIPLVTVLSSFPLPLVCADQCPYLGFCGSVGVSQRVCALRNLPFLLTFPACYLGAILLGFLAGFDGVSLNPSFSYFGFRFLCKPMCVLSVLHFPFTGSAPCLLLTPVVCVRLRCVEWHNLLSIIFYYILLLTRSVSRIKVYFLNPFFCVCFVSGHTVYRTNIDNSLYIFIYIKQKFLSCVNIR